MKKRVSEFELLTLLTERITHLGAGCGMTLSCDSGGIVPVESKDKVTNWTWNKIYPNEPGCIKVVLQAVNELQETHDVKWPITAL